MQELTVIALVLGGLAFVAWYGLKSLRGREKPGCGGCGGCGQARGEQAPPPAKTQFLPSEFLRRRSR
jgi:hypothetical protein